MPKHRAMKRSIITAVVWIVAVAMIVAVTLYFTVAMRERGDPFIMAIPFVVDALIVVAAIASTWEVWTCSAKS